MKATEKSQPVIFEDIENRIIALRGENVMLDCDVAALYGVETKEVNQAVKNNPEKFPEGYVFTIDKHELMDLRSKILTANNPQSRVFPKAFTEKGLYMLATILKSERPPRGSMPNPSYAVAKDTLKKNDKSYLCHVLWQNFIS